jgi:hypothetical protein
MKILLRSISLVSFLLSSIVMAAVPPLSQEMRESMADLIVTGLVKNIVEYSSTKQNGDVDHIYEVSLDIGADSNISFQYWKAEKRAQGYCGRNGQYGDMVVGQKVKVYMYSDDNNKLNLLDPNGFDVTD